MSYAVQTDDFGYEYTSGIELNSDEPYIELKKTYS